MDMSNTAQYFDSEQFSDVLITFPIFTKVYRAHKEVLVARSKLFEELLANDPDFRKEWGSSVAMPAQGRIIILTSPPVFEPLLRFMYTLVYNLSGFVSPLPTSAIRRIAAHMDVWETTREYGVSSLADQTSSHIVTEVDALNGAGEVEDTIDRWFGRSNFRRHNYRINKRVSDAIVDKAILVLGTERLDELKELYPRLADDLRIDGFVSNGH